MSQQEKRGFWYGFNIAAITLITLFLLGLPLLQVFASLLQNVDLRAVQNEAAFAYVPTTFSIELSNQQGELLNAVEFELAYDPSAILITHITPHSTLCEERFIITNRIDTASGTALFQCGTISPYKGSTGTIATVHAIPLRSGTSTVSFKDATHVLAHDGYGTDKTRDLHDLAFKTN